MTHSLYVFYYSMSKVYHKINKQTGSAKAKQRIKALLDERMTEIQSTA